jgi:hypothetical protein
MRYDLAMVCWEYRAGSDSLVRVFLSSILAERNPVIPLVTFALITIAGWIALAPVHSATIRNFLRMLLLAVLWSPVPITTPGFASWMLPSSIYLWQSLKSGRGDTLAFVVAVSITAVLAAVLLVFRTAVRAPRQPRS